MYSSSFTFLGKRSSQTNGKDNERDVECVMWQVVITEVQPVPRGTMVESTVSFNDANNTDAYDEFISELGDDPEEVFRSSSLYCKSTSHRWYPILSSRRRAASVWPLSTTHNT